MDSAWTVKQPLIKPRKASTENRVSKVSWEFSKAFQRNLSIKRLLGDTTEQQF